MLACADCCRHLCHGVSALYTMSDDKVCLCACIVFLTEAPCFPEFATCSHVADGCLSLEEYHCRYRQALGFTCPGGLFYQSDKVLHATNAMSCLSQKVCCCEQAGAGGPKSAAGLHGLGQPGCASAVYLWPAVLLPSVQSPARPGDKHGQRPVKLSNL